MTAVIAVSSGGGYTDLPAPAYDGYRTTPEEITKSSRNTLGNLYKYRITVKATIEVEWHGVTPAQKDLICGLTEPNSFNVRYFDTFTGAVAYGQFYRGASPEVTPLGRWTGSDFQAYHVKISLVEF